MNIKPRMHEVYIIASNCRPTKLLSSIATRLFIGRSRRPCGLRNRSAAAWLLRSRVQLSLVLRMFISCVCWLCGMQVPARLMILSEEPYRVCVSNCVWS